MPTPDTSLEDALSTIVGSNRVSASTIERVAYSRDLWPRSQLERIAQGVVAAPKVIVWPETVEQVSAVIKLCVQRRVPIVPFGAGSGVCGGARPDEGSVVVDLKRMRKVRRFEPNLQFIEVESGAVGQRLESWMNNRGFSLGHFPSSILCSTVGGWVATRSAGQCSSRYGKIEDMVVDLEVVTGEGKILRTPAGPAGADWNQLIIGSEGTLGIITSCTLRMHPLPEKQCFQGWSMPSTMAGLEVMRRTMQAGLKPSVLRLYDAMDTRMVGASPDGEGSGGLGAWIKGLVKGGGGGGGALRTFLRHPGLSNFVIRHWSGPSLMVAISEGRSAEADGTMDAMRAYAREAGAVDLGEAPGRSWLAHRHDVSFKQSKIYKNGSFVDTFEVATTWSGVLPLYEAVRKAVSSHVVVMAHFSHVYPGGCSIYFTLAGGGSSIEAMTARYDAAWHAAIETTQAHGGAIAHHHGVGLSRKPYMAAAHGEGTQWFHALKATFDPHGILNPGKLFEPEAP